MNTEEIVQKYLANHDALGSQKDAENKDKFDKQHRKIWARCDEELLKRRVKLEAKKRLTPEEQPELEDLRYMLK